MRHQPVEEANRAPVLADEPAATPWPDALVALYRARFADEVRLAYLLTGRRDVAEELVQDAFLAVAGRWGAIERPEGYLRAATVNRCRSWFRRVEVEARHREQPEVAGDLAPPGDVFDPDAAPGARGTDVVAVGEPIDLAPGTYRIEVRAESCAAERCLPGGGTRDDYAKLDARGPEPDLVCEGELEVRGRTETYVRFRTDGTCEGPGPVTPERLQAADVLLAHQEANGWVPYRGDPALPDVTDTAGWVPYGFGGGPACERPPTWPADTQLQCVYDAPNGTIVGYAVSSLGFVPIDRVGEIDVDAALVQRLGCSPRVDPACEARSNIERVQRQLADESLPADQRAPLEQLLADLQAYVAHVEGG